MEVKEMSRDLEHPEITCTLRTGYPSWAQESGEPEDNEGFDEEPWEDDQEAYCDHLYEERRERELFGDY
jgi:hypothetical protein